MSINEAIKKVFSDENRPLTPAEIYEFIVSKKYYEFKAEQPFHVVRSQLRRHTKGLDFPSASPNKFFNLLPDNKYELLKYAVIHANNPNKPLGTDKSAHSLRLLHDAYDKQAKESILSRIQKLDPETFEHFSKGLLKAYGFSETTVTPYSKDGGIDGHGKLKIGISWMKVAFQSKRYTKKKVGKPEINQFRGSIQGKFDQGIIFTTSDFVSGAVDDSFRPGAVPIILINGPSIIDIMIEKRYGVQVDHIPIYTYALDLESDV